MGVGMTAPLPDRDRLHELLQYDEASGNLTWRHREWIDPRGRRREFRFSGQQAGCVRTDSRHVVMVDGKLFVAARLIWKMVHGVDPVCVDHINGDPRDNRLSNLRNVTQAENNTNVRRRSDNTSGCAGVSYRPDRGTWRAYLRGKTLGTFKTKQDAVEARLKAQEAAGFSERHGK